MSNLFRFGDFTLHSGNRSLYKIDCDCLTDDDWATLAIMIHDSINNFYDVIGVPTGGLKLANALEPYCSRNPRHPTLIVDDVLTTGNSMENARKQVERDCIGAVVFARSKPPYWITPLFSMTQPHRTIVALPAYNEEKYIAGIVSKAIMYADVVVVLDDGSTDNTAWEAMGAGAQVEYHRKNRGYGATIQSILDFARKENPDVLVIMDADNQHSPDDTPAMVEAIQDGCDLAIGCRAGSDVPFYRRVGGTTLSVFAYLLSGVWVQDSQCGFRAYSRRAVDAIRPKENGMAVSSEIVALASWAGLGITEVPISVRYTDDSSTHNPWKQGFYTLWRILVMMVRRRLGL